MALLLAAHNNNGKCSIVRDCDDDRRRRLGGVGGTSCMVECGGAEKVHGRWEEGVSIYGNGEEEMREAVG